ncbi:MAG: exo-alpha-sialidase [Clostridia bacterium]|nr:exo-alpha-sialidase [Clostridia bacterium]
MKKRIFALLLSALLLANATACNTAPKNDAESSFEDTNTTESTVEEIQEETTEGETSTETKYTIACNGAYRNSNVKYAITEEGKLILYIGDWNESFIVPNENMYFVFETLFASSVVIGENRGALIYNDFSRPTKPIKVIQFTKENQKVTIENLNFETLETSENYYAFKYCSFIDEQTGYLFLFNINNNGKLQLSNLIKTTDGGQTWVEQLLNNIPSFYRRENIICAKMLNENVGLIAGSYYSDENFSRRTYVTADGGLTWSGVDIQYPKNSFELGLGCEEACDILYEDGTYILICRFRSYREDSSVSYIWVKYASTDLKTWTEVQ